MTSNFFNRAQGYFRFGSKSAHGTAPCDELAIRTHEARLFFDPAFLRSSQRAHVWERLASSARRFGMVFLLALLTATFATAVQAEDGPSSSDASSSEEERRWIEWLMTIMADEGGSNDPEAGTE
jgi:hypothetical protein